MATYYVATTGNDAVSCTTAQNPGTPKLTISAGVACAAAGDTVYIRAGTYTGSLNVIDSQSFTVASGTIGNVITISAYPGETVTIRPPFGSSAIRLTTGGPAYLFFVNLILDGVNSAGFTPLSSAPAGIFISTGASNNTWTGVTVTNWPNFGIHWSDQNAEPVGNTFSNGLVFDNGTDAAGPTEGHGLYITATSSLLENNLVHDNAGYGFHLYDTSGPKDHDDNIVRNNRISGNGSAGAGACFGIIVAWGNDNLVYNNLVYHNTGGGILVYTGSLGMLIYNNTVTGNSSTGINLEFYDSAPLITNNIVWNNGAGIVDNGGTGTPTLTTNLTTDPLFVDAGSDNYDLLEGSPAIDAGTTVAEVPTDFLGTSRPQFLAYDIGAYEFLGDEPPPDAAMEWTVVVIGTAQGPTGAVPSGST